MRAVEAVLVAALVAAAVAYRAPPNTLLQTGSGISTSMPEIVRNKYHTTDEILNELSALEKNCNVLTKHEIAASADNGPARSHVAYTLTQPNVDKSHKKRFMLTFGMHGREYISSETALHMTKFVCGRATGAPAALEQQPPPQQQQADQNLVAQMQAAAEMNSSPPPTGNVIKAHAMQNIVAANPVVKSEAPPSKLALTPGAPPPAAVAAQNIGAPPAKLVLKSMNKQPRKELGGAAAAAAAAASGVKVDHTTFKLEPVGDTGAHNLQPVQGATTLAMLETESESASDASAGWRELLGDEGAQLLLQTGAGVQGLDSKMSADRVMQILQNTEITFIPILNMEGRKKVETGGSCTAQRKNGRGVDVNRNFKDWFNPGNARDFEEDYQGPMAMSEWENRVVDTLATQFQPHAYLDIHSGDRGMGYVYGHSATELPVDNELNRQWVNEANKEAFGGQVWTGNLARMGAYPYESHGSSCDFMYSSHHVKVAGTWEIWRKAGFFSSFVVTGAEVIGSGETLALKPAAVNTNPPAPSHEIKSGALRRDDGSEPHFLSLVQEDQRAGVLQSLVQTAYGEAINASTGFHAGLGLHVDELQALVETEAGHRSLDEMQVLLQEMGREECFAYFNPIKPNDYDETVSGFTHAILVGAEKLSTMDAVKVAYGQ